MRFLNSVVDDPGLWVKACLLRLFPVLAYEVIPIFECIGIVLEIRVLAPSFEASDCNETILEGLDDCLAEFVLSWE